MAKPISISEMFKGYKGFSLPTSPGMDFATTTRTLPFGGGTFNSVTPAPYGSIDYVSPTVPVGHLFGETPDKKGDWAFPQPVVQTPPAGPQGPVVPTPTKSNVPPQYINPATGGLYSPEEFAAILSKSIPGGGNDVPTYAGNAIVNPNQTESQMTSSATNLNNARNDIATGTTDPYGAASKSGIAYSPSELKAIESAYAGVYDPALKDVFTKLEIKKKEEEQKTADQRMKDEIKLRTDEAIREYNATTALHKTAAELSQKEKDVQAESDYTAWLADFKVTNKREPTEAEKAAVMRAYGLKPSDYGIMDII